MRIFLKLLMAVVVLAVMAPFYLKDKQGAALMSLSDLKMPNLSMPKIPESMESAVSDITPEALLTSPGSTATKEKIRIHKWKDEDGVWHFSSSDDSKEGNKSEVVTITLNDKNRYKSAPLPKQQNKETTSSIDIDNITPSPLLPFTHGKETMDQARQIKKILEQRQKLQQQVVP